MTHDDRPLDYEHRGIDYDYQVPPPDPAQARRVRLYIVAILALAALALWASHRTAQAQEQPRALVVNYCVAGKCQTVRLEVRACTAGGQAEFARWLEDHPAVEVRAWKCLEGELA